MQGGEPTGRLSGGRLAAILVLATVALLAFLLLGDVRLNAGDPVFEGLTDQLAKDTWTTLLLAIQGFCLLIGLALLTLGPRPDAWAGDSWKMQSDAPSGTAIQIACPGCGTVFEKMSSEVDEPREQTFRCPNCGRAGHLRLGLHRAVQVRDLVCTNCGRDFQSFRAGAECPHCHAAQA